MAVAVARASAGLTLDHLGSWVSPSPPPSRGVPWASPRRGFACSASSKLVSVGVVADDSRARALVLHDPVFGSARCRRSSRCPSTRSCRSSRGAYTGLITIDRHLIETPACSASGVAAARADRAAAGVGRDHGGNQDLRRRHRGHRDTRRVHRGGGYGTLIGRGLALTTSGRSWPAPSPPPRWPSSFTRPSSSSTAW